MWSAAACAAAIGFTSPTTREPWPGWLTPKLHWRTSTSAQGDPTGTILLAGVWHTFVIADGAWMHATSSDAGVSWQERGLLALGGGGIGTGSFIALPNGTLLGLYSSSAHCGKLKSLTCIGLATSDDPSLQAVRDHGIVLTMPRHLSGHNLSGFRDPSAFLVELPPLANSLATYRLCTVIGANVHDCSHGGAKTLLYCTADLTNLFDWSFVSVLSSSFTRPRGATVDSSDGIPLAADGCTGLVSCPDFFPMRARRGDSSSTSAYWLLIGNYNTWRSGWFPPSRWSIGAFNGSSFTSLSTGTLGGDYDFVPKTGADANNDAATDHVRRLWWSNIGVPLGDHNGWLSFSRELTVAADEKVPQAQASSGRQVRREGPTLRSTFIPELQTLRIRTRHARVLSVQSALRSTTVPSIVEQVGDSVLLTGVATHQLEIRATFSPRPGATGAYGITLLAGVEAAAEVASARLTESTRVGYDPSLRMLFIDRSSSHAGGGGWPGGGRWPADQPCERMPPIAPACDAVLAYPLDLRDSDGILELTVYADGALLEVGVNNLTTLASVALPAHRSSERAGVFGISAAAAQLAIKTGFLQEGDAAIEAWALRPLYAHAHEAGNARPRG